MLQKFPDIEHNEGERRKREGGTQAIRGEEGRKKEGGGWREGG